METFKTFTVAKEITHFTIPFRSKNLTHFTNFSSLNIIENILPQHSEKPYSLYKCSSKHVSGWCQKKHLYCIISRCSRTSFSNHLESKCRFTYVYICKKMFVPKTQEASVRWGLNNFLQAAPCLALVKCFKFFHFNWNFWKFKYFSAFPYCY